MKDTIYKIKTGTIRLKTREDMARGRYVQLSNPSDAVGICRDILDEKDADQEHLILLCVNVKNKLTSTKILFSGCMDEITIDMRVVFRNTLLLGAANIIIAHNHPSGDPAPSSADKDLTKRVSAAGKLLGIRLLDHLVIVEENYFSFRERQPDFLNTD